MTQENFEYIEFPDGMFGFEDSTRFLPMMIEEGSDAVLLLQNMENEELSFIVMNPFMLCEEYDPILSDEDYAKLGTRGTVFLCNMCCKGQYRGIHGEP